MPKLVVTVNHIVFPESKCTCNITFKIGYSTGSKVLPVIRVVVTSELVFTGHCISYHVLLQFVKICRLKKGIGESTLNMEVE